MFRPLTLWKISLFLVGLDSNTQPFLPEDKHLSLILVHIYLEVKPT